jgi:hypothetical protein
MIGEVIGRPFNWAIPARALMVLALRIGSGNAAAHDEDELEIVCRSLLQRSVFNCGCTTEFLEQHFNTEQAEILLQLWVFAVNDDAGRDLPAVYIRYGREAIDGAVMRFDSHRDRLRIYCENGGAPAIAD